MYLTLWNLDEDEIPIESIRAQAFDSPEERARVADLLDAYNNTLTLSPEQDRAFGEIARERTARHPLRTYVTIPALRSLAMWFTPRVELLPFSGRLWPLRSEWESDREDFAVSMGFFLVNCVYVGLALAGAWIARRRPGLALLLVFIVIRTSFFAYFIETPEPRYVIECFPAIIALAAQVFARPQLSSSGSG